MADDPYIGAAMDAKASAPDNEYGLPIAQPKQPDDPYIGATSDPLSGNPTTRAGALLKAAAEAPDEAISALPYQVDRDQLTSSRKKTRDILKQEAARRGGYDAAAADQDAGPGLTTVAGQLLTANQSAFSNLMQTMEGHARDQGAAGTFIDNMGQGLGTIALPVLRGATASVEKLTGSAAAHNFGQAQDLAQLQTNVESSHHFAAGLAGQGAGMLIDMAGGPSALAAGGMNKALAPLLNPILGLPEKAAVRAILEGTPAAQVLARNLPDNVIRGVINFGTIQAAPYLLSGDLGKAADAFKQGATMGAVFHLVNQSAERETFDEFMRRNARYGQSDLGETNGVDPAAWAKAAPRGAPPVDADEVKSTWKDWRQWVPNQDAATLQKTVDWLKSGPQEQGNKVARQLAEEELGRRQAVKEAVSPKTDTQPPTPQGGSAPGSTGEALAGQETGGATPPSPPAEVAPPTNAEITPPEVAPPTPPPEPPAPPADNSPAEQLRRQAEETRGSEEEFKRAKAEADALLEQAKKATEGKEVPGALEKPTPPGTAEKSAAELEAEKAAPPAEKDPLAWMDDFKQTPEMTAEGESTAKKLGVEYKGAQVGASEGNHYQVYQDPETKSSFLVGRGEDPAEKLVSLRKKFAREAPIEDAKSIDVTTQKGKAAAKDLLMKRPTPALHPLHGTDISHLPAIAAEGLQPAKTYQQGGSSDESVVYAAPAGQKEVAVSRAIGSAKNLPVILVLKPRTAGVSTGPGAIQVSSKGKSYVAPADVAKVLIPGMPDMTLEEAAKFAANFMKGKAPAEPEKPIDITPQGAGPRPRSKPQRPPAKPKTEAESSARVDAAKDLYDQASRKYESIEVELAKVKKTTSPELEKAADTQEAARVRFNTELERHYEQFPHPEDEDATPTEPAVSEKAQDEPVVGDQGGASPSAPPTRSEPHTRDYGDQTLRVGDVDVEQLDADKPEDAAKIVAAFGRLDFDDQLKLSRSSALSVDRAFRTVFRPVEVPELKYSDDATGKMTTDTQLWALPGKEKAMAEIGRKMADVGIGPHGPEAPAYELKMGKLKTAPPKAAPKEVKTDADKMKAIAEAAGDDTRYSLGGIHIDGKGKELVATDGHRLFHAKKGEGTWGADGDYELPEKSGKLVEKKGEKDQELKFPEYKDIIGQATKDRDAAIGGRDNLIDVPRTLRRVRQALAMAKGASINNGVIVLLNKDGTIGFSVSSPGEGVAEIGVDPLEGLRQLGGINAKYLQQALEFHSKMGDDKVRMWWATPNKPVFFESATPGGDKVTTVTMPVNVENDAAENVRKELRSLASPDTVAPEPEGKGAAAAPSAAPSHAFAQPPNLAGSGDVLVRPEEIPKLMEAMTGTPIRYGHGWFAQMRAVGWFSPKMDVIRNKVALDLATAAHEFGHSVNAKLLGWNTRWPRAIVKELRDMGRQLYGSRNPNGGYTREGFAEYVARFMLGDTTANFPETHKWFTQTILPAHPEFAKQWDQLKGMYEAWNAQGAAGRIAAKINRIDNSFAGVARRGFEYLQNKLWREYRRTMTNDAATLDDSIKKIEESIGAKIPFAQNPGRIRQALKGTYAGTAHEFVVGSALGRNYERVGPGLAEVLQPIKKDLDKFVIYAYARRGLDLLARNINPGISAKDAMQAVRQFKSPAFDDALDAVTQWSSSLIDWLVSAGGLSPEAAQTIRDLNPVYIPLKRFFDEEQHLGGAGGGGAKRGSVNQGRGVKRIKGSGRSIVDPFEALAMQAEATIRLANKLDVANAIVRLAEKNNNIGWFAHKVQTPMEGTSFTLEKIAKQLEAMGVDLSNADLTEILKVFDNAQAYHGKDNIVALWRNGKREFWELHPDVYRVVTEMDKDQPGVILATFAKFKRLVQLGATGMSPAFAFVKNPLRDMVTHYIFTKSDEPLRALYGWFDGLQAELRGTKFAHLWKAAGGEMGTLMGQDRAAAGKLVREGLQETRAEKLAFTARHPVDALRQFFGLFESAPRISEFKSTLESAMKTAGNTTPSRLQVLEALLASKEVTVDFTRAGTIGQALNMMIPFFNARLQGSSKFFRTFSGQEGRGPATKAWGRVLPLVIGSVLLWWIHHNDDWYQKRDEWEKENYWLFSPDGGKHVIRIPKSEIGYAFGTLPVQALQSASDKDKQAVGDALVDSIGQFVPVNSPFDLVPAMLKPATEALANYDSFKNRAIDNGGDLEKLPKDRYTDYTSKAAVEIGKLLNVSPKRIDQMIRGYTGGLGSNVLATIDAVTSTSTKPKTAADLPVVGTLFSRDPSGGGAYSTQVYDRFTQLSQQKGSHALSFAEQRELDRLEEVTKDLSEWRTADRKDPAKDAEFQKRETAEAKWAIGKADSVPVDLAGKGYFRARIREALLDDKPVDAIAQQFSTSPAMEKPSEVKAMVSATRSGLAEQMLGRMADAIAAKDQASFNQAMDVAVRVGLKPLRQNVFLQQKGISLATRTEFVNAWQSQRKEAPEKGR